jgi:putative endonuclease
MLGPHDWGKSAEALAAAHLKKAGYRILATNYRNRFGEIDLVARHKSAIVFVEVKARRTNRYGSAKAAVTEAKKRKLSRLALAYLKETGQHQHRARFDVVAIQGSPTGPRVDVIENAFDLIQF